MLPSIPSQEWIEHLFPMSHRVSNSLATFFLLPGMKPSSVRETEIKLSNQNGFIPFSVRGNEKPFITMNAFPEAWPTTRSKLLTF